MSLAALRCSLVAYRRSWPLRLLHERSYAKKAPALPQVAEEDIEETFVKGSGPGGQAINKTNISVSLLHRPTGPAVINTMQGNTLMDNARKILRERVDLALNPGASKLEAKWSKEAAKKAAKERKRKRKLRDEATSEGDAEKSANNEVD